MHALAGRWAARGDVAIRHVTGSRDWDEFRTVPDEGPADGAALVYQTVAYEQHMDLLLAAADVVVSRAGGTTVAELAVVGVPAVLVPLPIATRDHQTANAQALVRGGAARLVPDAELDVDRLEAELGPLVDDAELRTTMAAAARAQGIPDAAARVAALLEREARS
ncbi:MAG: glycosyltransferase [Acidimicrobiales bacterium]